VGLTGDIQNHPVQVRGQAEQHEVELFEVQVQDLAAAAGGGG
jgi:hypothetical protein